MREIHLGLISLKKPGPAGPENRIQPEMDWIGDVIARGIERATPGTKDRVLYLREKSSWFIEKLTKERRARPKDQQEARRICRSRYNEAAEFPL
jgi:hypothetical protein